MKKLLLAASLSFAVLPAQAATIAPHRAIYDLGLLQLRQGADLSSIKGRLAFEIDGSTCEGWTVSFRMINKFQPMEGDAKLVDTQSTSYESADALVLRYNQHEFINRAAQPETRISVARDGLDKDGKGEQGDKGSAPFIVPPGTAFPMQHQFRLMAAAEKGQSRDDSMIYDGSDADKTFRAISFIGKRKAPGGNVRDAADGDAAALSGLASWPVTISYYHGDSGDTPDYQVSFDIYENGVATGLVLDYGDFVLGGDLAKLELLETEPCK